MKRYLAFVGDQYYAGGGMEDFINDFHTLSEAKHEVDYLVSQNDERKWGHVYDTVKREIVYNNNYAYT